MKKPAILQELGVLLDKSDEEYSAYANVYDKKHGYYDESQVYGWKDDFEALKDEAITYVKDGCEGTYAIITDEGIGVIDDDKNISELTLLKDKTYEPTDVIWSMAKINGVIVENFVENQPK